MEEKNSKLSNPQQPEDWRCHCGRLNTKATLNDPSLFLRSGVKYPLQVVQTVIGESFRFYLKTLQIKRGKEFYKKDRSTSWQLQPPLGLVINLPLAKFFKNSVGFSSSCLRKWFEDIPKSSPDKTPMNGNNYTYEQNSRASELPRTLAQRLGLFSSSGTFNLSF